MAKGYRKGLPPLGALVAFEAAARHLSFRAAGEELFLTQAAISKQIRLLEENLQHKLFVRSHRSVTLTLEGRAFLHVVSQSLAQIASAAVELRIPADDAPLIVSVGHSFAFLWLSRHLPDFYARCPKVKLDLLVLEEQRSPQAGAVNLTIIAGDGRWPGFQSVLLNHECVFPVCSPSYLKMIGGLPDPDSLMRANLIELDDAQPACTAWRTWLTSNGVQTARQAAALRMNSYPLVIEAARAGLGVALGWDALIADFLADGTLIRPMPQTLTTRIGYYVAWPTSVRLTDSARLFINWLADRLGITAEPPSIHPHFGSDPDDTPSEKPHRSARSSRRTTSTTFSSENR